MGRGAEGEGIVAVALSRTGNASFIFLPDRCLQLRWWDSIP